MKTMRKLRGLWLVAVVCLVFVWAQPDGATMAVGGSPAPFTAPIAAATITVNDTGTAIANDGKCTLPEAIIAANIDTASGALAGECPAGSGADTIELPSGAVITFTTPHNFEYGPNALPQIASQITINGNGATLARSSAAGTPKFRFFYVSGGLSFNSGTGAGLPAGNLTLNNLTLSGGLAKGGDSLAGGGGMGQAARSSIKGRWRSTA